MKIKCQICEHRKPEEEMIGECCTCGQMMCQTCQSAIEGSDCRECEAREVKRALLACHRLINSISLVDESKKEEMGFPMGPAIRAELTSELIKRASDGLLTAIQAELAESFELAETQLATEKLGGNRVKEEFWKGELAALHRMRVTVEANAKAQFREERA